MSEVLKDFSANIDLKETLVFEPIKVVEGDNGNVLVLKIVKDGEPVDLTDCLVQIVFAHSGRTVWQDSSSPSGGITISGDDHNIVTVRMHSDSFAPNGITVCQVKVYSGVGQETLVSSSRFSFKAELSLLNAETVESIEQYSILVTLIEACNSVLNRDQADWDETDTLKVSFVRNKPVADIDAHASRHYNGGADAVAPALIGAEAMRMVFDGVTVAATGWATYTPSGDEETAIAALGFTYKKTVTLEDVTADMDVAVDPLSGYYSCGADVCSIAVPTTDGVVLYANAVPASAFTINATAWRAAGDVPGVDETVGAQLIADAAAAISAAELAVATAESSATDATDAKNAAETAQGLAENARDTALLAQGAAEDAAGAIPSTHNGFDGLQGGSSAERYHMTQAQNTALHSHANKTALDNVFGLNTGDQSADDFNHNDLANKQGGTAGEYYHVTAAEKTVIEHTSGENTGDQDVSGAISTHNADAGAHAALARKSETMRLLISRTIGAGENVSAITWTQDDAGNALALIEMRVVITVPSNTIAVGTSGYFNARINGISTSNYYQTGASLSSSFANIALFRTSHGAGALNVIKASSGKMFGQSQYIYSDGSAHGGSISPTMTLFSVANVDSIYILMSASGLTYFPEGTTVNIYGRTA